MVVPLGFVKFPIFTMFYQMVGPLELLILISSGSATIGSSRRDFIKSIILLLPYGRPAGTAPN